ncbi:ferritin-like fold-containing protein [Protaetiibacter larvae]|uniref:ferritin-like fold-containing protein n=1 Tax=Protaetiibacter larvae TaxID=2592654 RepID=UPI00143DA217|nr:ferritin-like fold-containing protein [Protaetiibacter larvae]
MAWFRRRTRPRPASHHVAPRSEAVAVARVELADLAPAPERFLGQTAYLTIVLFENLGRAVTTAPTTDAKTRLTHAASELLAMHQELVGLLREHHDDPTAQMDPFRLPLDDFQRRTKGADWHEILVTCYLTNGFLLDFFAGLAAGLPRDLADRAAEILQRDKGEEVLVGELRLAIEENPRVASRLAMWGRRLIGDTMLVARSAIEQHGTAADAAAVDERVDPVFTELIAAHTRRMDALGLTA